MPTYNPSDAFFLLNSALNANNFYPGKNTSRVVNWDQSLNQLQLVDTTTGDILQVLGQGANIADLGNILFVSPNGNNTTGTKGRIDLPYSTILAAQTDASAGDTIFVFPGSYSATLLGKDGVNYYFSPGTEVSQPSASPNAFIFSDGALGISFNVYGSGNFTNSNSGIVGLSGDNSSVFFQANKITTSTGGAGAFYLESTIANNSPAQTITIEINELEATGNGLYIYSEGGTTTSSTMNVIANSISTRATTIVTIDLGNGVNPPYMNVVAQKIENSGSAVDSICIHNIGGKMNINCPNIIKSDRSPNAPVVLMNPGSVNQEGYISLTGNIFYLPKTGITTSDYILFMGAGSSKISADIYGDAISVYSGGIAQYSNYFEGYIESRLPDSPTINIQALKAGQVFINGRVQNNAISLSSYGILSATDKALVLLQNAVIITTGATNSIQAPTLDITSFPGCAANNAINVGSELVSTITVDADVTSITLNP